MHTIGFFRGALWPSIQGGGGLHRQKGALQPEEEEGGWLQQGNGRGDHRWELESLLRRVGSDSFFTFDANGQWGLKVFYIFYILQNNIVLIIIIINWIVRFGWNWLVRLVHQSDHRFNRSDSGSTHFRPNWSNQTKIMTSRQLNQSVQFLKPW